MPILNGRRVSLAAWRAAQAPAEVPAADEADAAEAAPEKPKKPSRRTSKKDVAAQVQAALGITPEAAPADADAAASEENA